jgi:hypothetical protein
MIIRKQLKLILILIILLYIYKFDKSEQKIKQVFSRKFTEQKQCSLSIIL